LTGGILPEAEQPIYELAQPWVSPDDVYYVDGMVVVDVRGDITPNEFMIPKNEPAQRRYDAYMDHLASFGTGRQPTLAEVIDAASRATRELGPTASGNELQAAITAGLIARMGAPRPQDPGSPRREVARNVAKGDIPLMANTNITNAGVPQRPAVPKRGPARTRVVGQAAESSANVQGSVQTPPLSQQPA
jgi:hypothetical protein